MNVLLQFIRQKLTKIGYCLCWLCIFSCTTALAVEETKLPVHITADTVNFDNKTGVATYSGNVHVVQGARNLYANQLSIYRDDNNRIKVMVASGKPAKFIAENNGDKPGGHGCANTIKYYPQKDVVDLYGNARLFKNGDTISGPKLSYNFVTEILHGKSSKQQRTTVILQPKRAE